MLLVSYISDVERCATGQFYFRLYVLLTGQLYIRLCLLLVSYISDVERCDTGKLFF